MADIHSSETRSFNMSCIRSKNTKPELKVRRYLHSLGFRFKIHDRKLPGTPDIVLPKYKAVIEIRGCFWHSHTGCKMNRPPKSNSEFWKNKLLKNVQRDQANDQLLKLGGWDTIIVWECQLKKLTFEPSMNDIVTRLKLKVIQQMQGD